jgi:hypothetical protein
VSFGAPTASCAVRDSTTPRGGRSPSARVIPART